MRTETERRAAGERAPKAAVSESAPVGRGVVAIRAEGGEPPTSVGAGPADLDPILARALFELRTLAILVTDDDRNCLEASPGACELFGLGRERILAMRVDDLLPEGARPWVGPAWGELRRQGRLAGSMAVARSDGSSRHLEYVVVRDGVGPGRHLTTLTDVTAQRNAEEGLRAQNELLSRTLAERTGNLRRARAEAESFAADRAEALRESEDRFRVIVEELEAIVFVKDEATQVAFVSPFGETVLGYPAAALAAPGFWRSLVVADDCDRVVRAWDERTDHYELEYRMTTASGSTVWLRERMHPTYDASGAVRTWYGIAFDVTDLKRLEEEAARSQRLDALGRLAAAVAHDFDNVLYGISIFAGYLERGMAEDDERRSDVGEIVGAVARGRRLTRQLLDFSRGRPIAPVPVAPAPLVEALLPLVGRLLGDNVAIVPRIAEVGEILGDPAQIEQVVLNLATNAGDAMPEGGTLEISLRLVEAGAAIASGGAGVGGHPAAGPTMRVGRATSDDQADPCGCATPGGAPGAGRCVELAVSDTGIGMDAATRARIFEPFFTTKPVGSGTGLGLATVYGVVRALRGTISVESERGAGTTFRIHFPSLPASEDREPGSGEVDAGQAGDEGGAGGG